MAITKKTILSLCGPAKLFLALSLVGIILSIIQNLGSKGVYKIGTIVRKVPNTIFIFIFKIIYVIFWTWVLNLMCKDGKSWVAWLLVLAPFILFFMIVALLAFNPNLAMKLNKKMK
jgi:hypothetical protein